ncbi:MAG TPA: lysylphosphatidylglycerol synthase transmembrane domain-containing protein [Elusimicrobiales bacterium]|nr:lysylphosphatidylglycerol synthase transmembrane domain-containing protein [Elusimicrobiales bacterium]
MKAKVSIIAGVLVGAGLFYLAFRNINFRETLAICRGANSWYVIPFSFTVVAELFLRGVKWKLLLDPVRPVRVWDAFRLEAAGLALNNVLPLRLGEIVRGTSGATLFQIPVMTVFATILVERALDTIVLLLLLAAAVFMGGITGGPLEGGGAYLWPVVGGLCAAVGALIFIDEIIAHHFFAGFFGRFPRLKKGLGHLALGVKAFHSVKGCALILTAAAVQWLMNSLTFYWIARAFGINGVVGLAKSVVLIFTAAVACSVPGMPGYFGNFEATIAGVVAAWGVPRETGLAYAGYAHIAGYVLVTTIGLLFAYQMGHSVGKIWTQFSGGEKKDGAAPAA